MTRLKFAPILGVILGCVAALALTACGPSKPEPSEFPPRPSPSAQPPASPSSPAKSEVDQWADDGSFGGAFAEMRRDFPKDFQTLKTTVGDGLAKGEDHAKLKHQTFLAMRAIATKHTADAAKAPAAELVAMAEQQGVILHALQGENVQACGDFSMSAMREGTTLSKAADELVAHTLALQIHAARAGLDHPTTYPAFKFTKAETAAFVAAMRADGLAPPPGGFAAASSDVQCRAGITTQRFIMSMPRPRTAAFESAALIQAGKTMSAER